MSEIAAAVRRPWWKKKRFNIPLALLAILIFLHFPTGRVKIQVGKDTTVIDGPMNPDGTVNYVAYLDQEYSKGVTPDNNAAPLLLKVLGSSMLQEGMTKDEVLRRLGLDPAWLTAGPHFVPWSDRPRSPTTQPATAQAVEATDAKLVPQTTHPTMRGTTQPTTAPADEDVNATEPDLGDIAKNLDKGVVHPDLEKWLAQNAAALDLVCQATARPRYYIPLVGSSDPPTILECVLWRFSGLRDLARTLAVRARLRCRQGNMDGAWSDVLAVHRLARLVGRQPFLITQLVTIAIDSAATDAGAFLATHGRLEEAKANTMLNDALSLPPIGDVIGSIDNGERLFLCDAIMLLSRGVVDVDKPGGPGRPNALARAIIDLDWNEVLRGSNEWYDAMLKPLKTPRFAGRAEANAEFKERVKRLHSNASVWQVVRIVAYRLGGWPFRKALSREVTDVLMVLFLPSLQRAVMLQDAGRMSAQVECTALALACYKARHGRWPEKLADLTPDLLKAVPIDLFSDKPLVYRLDKGGYVLYSVGMNMKDDNGEKDDRERGDDSKPDDIAARAAAQ